MEGRGRTDPRRRFGKARRAGGAHRRADDRDALPRTVGSIFKSAREFQRLSQDDVAVLTESRSGRVSRTMISSIERGRHLPGLGALVSLTRVLHIDPLEILERVDLSTNVSVDLVDLGHDELSERADRYYWSGDYRSALAIYDTLLERLVLDPLPDEREQKLRHARIEVRRAVALRQCSALKAAKASVERAVELSRGDKALHAEAYMVLASVLSHQDLLVLATDSADRCVKMAEEVGKARLLGRAWSQMGNVLHRARRFEEARLAFLHGRKYALEAADHHTQIGLEGNIGACLMDLERVDQARRRFAQAVDLARRHEDPAAEAFWLVEMGEASYRSGDLENADRFAQAALRLAKPADRVLTVFRAEWLRHRIVRQSDAAADDRHRMAYLKKLYGRVKEHRNLDVVREYRRAVHQADAAEDRDE